MISACRRVRPHSGHRSGPISHVQRRRSHAVPLFADPGSALPDAFRDLLIIASRIGSARSASRSSRSSSAGSGSSRIATSAARAGCRPCRCGSAHRGLRRQNAGTPCTRRGSGSRSAPSCARSAGRQSSCRMVRPHPLRNLGSPSRWDGQQLERRARCRWSLASPNTRQALVTATLANASLQLRQPPQALRTRYLQIRRLGPPRAWKTGRLPLGRAPFFLSATNIRPLFSKTFAIPKVPSRAFTLCPALPDATGPENDPISAARMTSGCSAPS
jgi:hypothetical protein